MSKIDKLVVVGAVTGAFGVRGEVRVKTFTETPDRIVEYGPLLDAQGNTILSPTSARAVKDAMAVTAPESDSKEAADALRGTLLHVPRRVLPEPEEDDFYYTDLVGLEVKTTDGKRAGTVSGVHEFGAGDVLEITPHKGSDFAGGKAFFHPFTKAATPKVDLAKGRVIIDWMETDGADEETSP